MKSFAASSDNNRLSPGEVQAYIQTRLPHVSSSGVERRGPCAIHQGKGDNFTINAETGLWDCKSKCGRGGDVYDYEMAITGADFKGAKAEVFGIVGRVEQPRNVRVMPSSKKQARGPVDVIYSYTDSDGRLLHQTVRHRDPKSFNQRRPDGEGGFIYNLDGVQPVPFNLPAVVKAEKVFITEGEKDCIALAELGLIATTNSGGAGNFKPELAPYFAGKHVVIFPDNDEPGRKHGETVAALVAPVAASVRVVALPGLPEKGDVSDWIGTGGTEAQLRALVRETPLWAPAAQLTESETVDRPGIRSITDLKPLSFYASQVINWVADGIIAEGALTMVSGDSGSGKTSVADSICHAVVNGEAFAGHLARPRPVLVMDRENPPAVVQERRGRLGITETPEFRTWGGWCEDEACDPGSPIILEWVASCDPKPLIVIDSFVAFARCDENSASEVRAFMQPLRRLADMGASVILLHHSGKGESSKEFRGSSDIKAAVDVAYHLVNLGDSSRLSTLRLKAFKARFSVIPELILHYVEGVGFRADDRGPVLTVSDALRDVLIQNPNIGVSEFEEMVVSKGFARSRARQFMADGISRGDIEVTKGQRNLKYHNWAGNRA